MNAFKKIYRELKLSLTTLAGISWQIVIKNLVQRKQAKQGEKDKFDNYTLMHKKGELQMALLRPFFTKLRFRQSFWGAKQVSILIGTKVMTQNAKTQKTQMCGFVQNCKKMEMKIFVFCVMIVEPIRIQTH